LKEDSISPSLKVSTNLQNKSLEVVELLKENYTTGEVPSKNLSIKEIGEVLDNSSQDHLITPILQQHHLQTSHSIYILFVPLSSRVLVPSTTRLRLA